VSLAGTENPIEVRISIALIPFGTGIEKVVVAKANNDLVLGVQVLIIIQVIMDEKI